MTLERLCKKIHAEISRYGVITRIEVCIRETGYPIEDVDNVEECLDKINDYLTEDAEDAEDTGYKFDDKFYVGRAYLSGKHSERYECTFDLDGVINIINA